MKPGRGYEFLVQVNPTADFGRNMEKVIFHTTNDKKPTFKVG